jgi:hypothetical protein
MSKKVSHVVIYYTDGTFEQINKQVTFVPIKEEPMVPFDPWKIPSEPYIAPHNPWNRDTIID